MTEFQVIVWTDLEILESIYHNNFPEPFNINDFKMEKSLIMFFILFPGMFPIFSLACILRVSDILFVGYVKTIRKQILK